MFIKRLCFFKVLGSWIIFFHFVQANDPTVDVALNKPITAIVTCGTNGPERFYSQRVAGIQQPSDSQICYNTSSYPPEFMVDGNPGTWWQSTSRVNFIRNGQGVNNQPDAKISIDLQQAFDILSITLRFGESQRPGRMIFYKSPSSSVATTPWFYVVTSTLDCLNKYNLPLSKLPQALDSRPCFDYPVPAVLNEIVTFDLTNTPTTIQEWKSVMSISVEFFDIDLTMGVTPGSNEFQHYAVRALEVLAKCRCNGQLKDCVVDNSTKKYTCVCDGFTTGENCEKCLPLYNNKPYTYGKPCEICNCNGHATSCSYDLVSNSGVCLQCDNSTAGINCEKCINNFYRPASVPVNSPNPCVLCDCTGPYTAGGCLATADPVNNPGMNAGDCFCRPNVVGPKCDRCKDGFYRISAAGCIDCGCLRNGTVGGIIACNDTGLCQCKQFVSGSQCSVCTDGYYNLDVNNPTGCLPCGCDVGGAVNNVCDKVTGQCTCKPGITERTCSKPASGYYFPGFYVMSAEMENLQSPWDHTITGYTGYGYVTTIPQVPVSTTINLAPLGSSGSDNFRVVLRYFSTAATSGTMSVGQGNMMTSTNPFNISACTGGTWCNAPTGDAKLPRAPPSTISFTFPIQLSLDRIYVIPVDYFNTSNLFGTTDVQSRCNIYNNAMDGDCAKFAFSMSASYFGGALPCQCDPMGSNDTNSCQPSGGQCFCKPGTTGRRCDACETRYFGLGLSGCSACSCSQTSYNMCDPATGNCLCPPGVEGLNCSTCKVNYYNWDRDRGCQPCGCNELGSTSLFCDVTSGQCTCKPGVTGVKCEQCLSGYKQMTVFGCTPCGCDPGGSVNGSFCDKVTGNCVCKANVVGTLCNTCDINAFTMSPDGCLACICMGVTKTCSSSNWLPTPFNTRPPSSSLVVLNGDGNSPSPSVIPSSLVDSGITFASINVPPGMDLYWSDPQLKGNMISFYGTSISYKVLWKATDTSSATSPQSNAVVFVSTNGKKISFLPSSNVAPLSGVVTQVNVVASLLNTPNVATSNLTRANILMFLTDIKNVLFPAVLKPTLHQSGIGDVAYNPNPAFVEDCYCPTGYEGKSCESCSVGNVRYNVTEQGFMGLCKPCECSGKSTTCNQITGYCSGCQQFTTGARCETCLPGYYRDPNTGALGPCLKCPCQGPRVGSNNCELINSTVTCTNCSVGYLGNMCTQCSPGYYGDTGADMMGTCKSCLCNNFSAVCDSIGVCQNCSNFTTGVNCEKCIPGKYKDPLTKQCIDCNCNVNGSKLLECNIETGQCDCQVGVGTRQCSECLPGFYSFSSTGCLSCQCNTYGSQNITCDQVGTCTCNNNQTAGPKCDQCLKGSFGILNGKPCEYCFCYSLGVVEFSPDIAQCNNATGQCNCLPHVVGRKCDRCEVMYSNTTERLNCTTCGNCERTLGLDIVKMQNTSRDNFLYSTMELVALQSMSDELSAVQTQMSQLCQRLGSCSPNNLYDKFKNSLDSTVVLAMGNVTKTLDLNASLEGLYPKLERLNNDSLVLMGKFWNISRDANQLKNVFGQQLSTSASNLKTLQDYNNTAMGIWKNPPYNGSSLSSLTWNYAGLFDKELSTITSLNSNIDSTIQTANRLLADLKRETDFAIQLQNDFRKSQDLYIATNSLVGSIKANLDSDNIRLIELMTKITSTLTTRSMFDSAFRAMQSSIASINSILASTAANLAVCQQTMAATIGMIYGNSTVKPPVLISSGFDGWNQAYDVVNRNLQDALLLLNISQPKIPLCEQKASALSTQAASIVSSFQSVQSRGQPAVDVVNKLQSVIASLQNSINQANSMDAALRDIIRFLNTVSPNDLMIRANQILASGNSSKQNLDNFLSTTTIIGLNADIDKANTSFQSSIATWKDLDPKLTAFVASSQDFQNFVTRTIQENNQNYTIGIQTANSLTAKTETLRQQNDMLQNGLNKTSADISNVASTIANSLNIQAQMTNNLTAFKAELDLINQTSASNLNVSQNQIYSSKTALEDQFARVDALLKQVQAKLVTLEQPVNFSGNTFEQATNPDSNIDQLYNSIGLEFSYVSQARGVMFFVENTLTQEKLLLQLVNNTVCFEFSFTDVKTILCNQAQLVARNWYRVYATRYENDAKLTVVQLSTGGSLTASARSVSTNSVRITLNSPIYVGGLALTATNIQKVYNSGVGFGGCIYRVVYNGATLPIWQSIMRSTSTATCCKKPSIAQLAPYILDCVTLYGFGYISYNPRDSFSLLGQAQISIQFRTFALQGVIFLTSSLSTSDYYGIFIRDGRVLFSISVQEVVSSVATDSSYNTGAWFKLTAAHTPTDMTLAVGPVDSTPTETKTVPALVNLGSIIGAGFMIGGQSPAFQRGPISYGFTGALKGFQHTTPSSSALMPESLTAGVNSSLNVDLNRCLQNVQAGLGFLNASSYSMIRPPISPIQTLDFTFITTAFSGLFIFANLEKTPSDPATFLYVALYNGDIFVIFDQGQGVQPAFRTRNLYLSNGLEHRVSLHFGFINSPRMKVDNLETHVGAVAMNSYMRLLDNSIYVGGVPTSMSLNPNFLPVKLSFVGGIKDMAINGIPIQFYDVNVINGQTSKYIYLSGIQKSVTPPPAPCNPCPTSATPLACIFTVPTNSYYDNGTYGFGVETQNYLHYDITGNEDVFSSSFQFSVNFKTLQPDGLVAYVADAATPTPANYFAVFIFKGFLNVLLLSNNLLRSVISKKTYYDGSWHKLNVYMTPNSLALLVQDSQDFNNYINNAASSLRVNSPLYAGGVPYALAPFPDTILSGKASFKGCLQGITFQSSAAKTITIDPSKILARSGVSLCSLDTKMGMSISTSGYVKVSDSYNVNPLYSLAPVFSIALAFKSLTSDGLLAVAWDSPSKFVSMSLVGGEVKVILSSVSQPFTFTSKAFKNSYDVCNNVFHNVVMTINLGSVTLNVDSNYTETKNFDAFQYAAPLAVPIYLAGVKDLSWNIPGIFSPSPFTGCIQKCVINGDQVYITQSSDVSGALSSCV